MYNYPRIMFKRIGPKVMLILTTTLFIQHLNTIYSELKHYMKIYIQVQVLYIFL